MWEERPRFADNKWDGEGIIQTILEEYLANAAKEYEHGRHSYGSIPLWSAILLGAGKGAKRWSLR
jgi:hypothetical protein